MTTIEAQTKGLGSLIELDVDGRHYEVSPAARGFLRRLWGQTYSVMEPSSHTATRVRYRPLANRIEFRKNGGQKVSLRLRTIGRSKLTFDGNEYSVKFGKLHGTIEITKGDQTVASGLIGTTSVRFQESSGRIETILPELAVGLCIWLKNFQGLLGVLLGGQT